MIKEMQVEVVDNLTLINRVRELEDKVKGLKLNKDEVNKTLDLHESELINLATRYLRQTRVEGLHSSSTMVVTSPA